jgi:HD-GYP domain-containing protein (c-di-GMP phosphodiesterase class II)
MRELVDKLRSFQEQAIKYADELKKVHETEEKQYKELKEAYEKFQQVYAETIRILADVIDRRSKYTIGHSERVRRYAELIGKRLYLSEDEMKVLDIAATLHDIGRMEVDQSIWDKPGKLTHKEFEAVKTHPAVGEKMLSPVPFLHAVTEVIRHHHEKYDGTGYPEGLKGEDIPLCSRILAVADAFDAMTSERAYRDKIDPEVAIEEIKSLSGTQFDPAVVDAFLSVWRKMYYSS